MTFWGSLAVHICLLFKFTDLLVHSYNDFLIFASVWFLQLFSLFDRFEEENQLKKRWKSWRQSLRKLFCYLDDFENRRHNLACLSQLQTWLHQKCTTFRAQSSRTRRELGTTLQCINGRLNYEERTCHIICCAYDKTRIDERYVNTLEPLYFPKVLLYLQFLNQNV